MPRAPRAPNAKPRRDEILDSATRLFAERGYEGTSMADLAEQVGMRKASLFYHFASKDVLYAAVLDRLIGAVSSAISTAATAEGSFAERLDNLSEAITIVLGEQPFAARLIVREAMDWGPVIRDTLADSILGVLSVAEQFGKAGQEAGVFVEADMRQIIISLIGVHFMPFAIGGIVQRFTGSEPFDPAFIAARKKAVRDQVRNMILVKRPTPSSPPKKR
jgi:AcrR family transcriptional regulator